MKDVYPDNRDRPIIRNFGANFLRGADISFSELLCQVRFEMTLPLLGNPDASLLEIGYSVGYSDPAHFSYAFRRWTGMSPKEYRRGLMK